ncbi:MAG: hypothetical protein ACUVXI_16595 [bacterium]
MFISRMVWSRWQAGAMLLAGLLVASLTGPVSGQLEFNARQEVRPGAFIDWTDMELSVTSRASPKEGDTRSLNDKLQDSLEKAKKGLDDLLTAAAKAVRIDEDRTVGSLWEKDKILGNKLQDFIKSSQVLSKPRYFSDGSVEIDGRLPLTGAKSLASLLGDEIFPETPPPGTTSSNPTVPEDILARIEAIEKFLERYGYTPPFVKKESGTPEKKEGGGKIFTGLIVDARELNISPSLSLRILSESRQVIYSPDVVDRSWALEQGMAQYTKSIGAAKRSIRAGNEPFVIKAVRAAEGSKISFIIRNADASALASAENADILRKAKVIIVVD